MWEVSQTDVTAATDDIKHIIVIIFIVSWDDAQIWYVHKGLQVRSHKSFGIWRIISMEEKGFHAKLRVDGIYENVADTIISHGSISLGAIRSINVNATLSSN